MRRDPRGMGWNSRFEIRVDESKRIYRRGRRRSRRGEAGEAGVTLPACGAGATASGQAARGFSAAAEFLGRWIGERRGSAAVDEWIY